MLCKRTGHVLRVFHPDTAIVLIILNWNNHPWKLGKYRSWWNNCKKSTHTAHKILMKPFDNGWNEWSDNIYSLVQYAPILFQTDNYWV